MKPESSLPCSQQPRSGPYSEPDKFKHALPPYFLKILPSTSSVLSGLFPVGFQLLVFSLIYYLYHAYYMSHSSYHTSSDDHPNNVMNSRNYEAPHCAAFAIPCYSSLLGPNILLGTLTSNTNTLHVLISIQIR
jgi:hypothetical protein